VRYLFQRGHISNHEITFNTNLPEEVKTRADFTYKITPRVISIVDTGLGSRSVSQDIEAVLQKIEHWHQGSISSFKIMCRDGKGFCHEVRWDDKTASSLLSKKPTGDKPARSYWLEI
jgi:hypothetical protein